MDRNIYLNEIGAMMHSFGDVKEPKEKSVLLMRSIVHDQMNLLLLQAEEISSIRGSADISYQDVLFLMRKNRMKLKRLLDYLYVWDTKQSYERLKELSSEEITFKNKNKKLQERCLIFLESIEDCDEFTSFLRDETVIDYAAKKRKMRRAFMTDHMSAKEYEEFSKTCQASFSPLENFKKWLLKDKGIIFGLTNFAVRIIDFLARETIAEIVDMVFITKMKKLGIYQPLYEARIQQAIGDYDHEGFLSPISLTNNVFCGLDSSYQMYDSEDDNLTKNSHESYKETDLDFVNEDSNEINPTEGDRVSSNSQHILQRERILDIKRKYFRSGSESRVGPISRLRVSKHSKSIDERELQCIKVDLNETTHKELKSKLVSVDSKKSQNVHSPTLNQSYDLISDDDTAFIPKYARTSTSSDMNKKAVPSNVSHNMYKSPNSSLTLENQGTPVAGTSRQLQENKPQIQDISDTSDCENIARRTMKIPDPPKPVKRKISVNESPRKVIRKEFIVCDPILKNHMIAAQNEVTYITKPIEPAEILEAVSLFQEPSPLVIILNNNHISKKTKLICLVESSALSTMEF